MDDDPFEGNPLGQFDLKPVRLDHQAVFAPFFASLTRPLSDYTFSQIYTWRNSLHIAWRIVDGHLCVFANGCGDLTLLMPPIGDGDTQRATTQAFELMNDYNSAAGVPDHSRIEYVSEELLTRLDVTRYDIEPMGTDYVYDTIRMIDLAGGDLASKRQAKNRFLRLYRHRVEAYDPIKHLDDCLSLLGDWRVHQDAQHLEEPNTSNIKRQKEVIATELALRTAGQLGLSGMVVYLESDSGQRLAGFTFGEPLGQNQSSITIEKTDLDTKGLAQFIFSEFCRRQWSSYALTNVGDDWGLPSLAWTKMSYRPVQLLQKYTLTQHVAAKVSLAVPASPQPVIRPAGKSDLAATVELEKTCFSTDHSLKKRQLQYLQQRPSAIFLVAEHGGSVIGEGIALLRQHKNRQSGRIYSLAVDENHRRQSIGQQLLQSMVAQLAQRGVDRVYLEVEQDNASAIALYARNGFKPIGVIPNYYGPGRDAKRMVCKPRSTAAGAT